jgi:hypothetical protein
MSECRFAASAPCATPPSSRHFDGLEELAFHRRIGTLLAHGGANVVHTKKLWLPFHAGRNGAGMLFAPDGWAKENIMRSSVIAWSLALVGLSACAVGGKLESDEGTERSDMSQELDKGARRKHCGGFGNFPCPSGFVCIDDPSDTCDPDDGGADCPGICAQSCGGFGNFPCPEPLVCVDDPTDNCNPDKGGADCPGVCVSCPSTCQQFCSQAADCSLPAGCENPGCKCYEADCSCPSSCSEVCAYVVTCTPLPPGCTVDPSCDCPQPLCAGPDGDEAK